MDPYPGAGSLFAPLPRQSYPSTRSSPSLLSHRTSPMPTRPDAPDDPFFTSVMSHPSPIPHTSVPFAPTELAVLQRWSQVYHSHRARCPVGPPPGMPSAVYDIFERLGVATQFAAQQAAAAAADYSASASQETTSSQSTADDSEAFRPEAWSSGTTDTQPTPGLYRSPDSDAPSSSPTTTVRSSSVRPSPVYNLGSSGVRLGSSPSYGALDQHMRALELKRGMKRSAAGHSRSKMSRTVSAPVKMGGGSSKASSAGIRSSPLVGMKSSSPPRHSSPLVGFGPGHASSDAPHEPQTLFSTGQPLQAPYQAYAAQAQTGTTAYAAEGFSFSAGYEGDQSGYTETQSTILDAQDGEGDKSMTAADAQVPIPPAAPTAALAAPAPPATSSTSNAAAVAAAVPKEKGKARASVSASERTDPNTMPDRNDPNVTIIEDPAALRGMRYEDFEPHMFIGRNALGTEYPRNLEPGAGHERIRCLLCKCGYAGPNGRSMWRRHVSQKHVILLAGKRGTVTKKKDAPADEAAVITNYMEKRERTLASKKRYASKKRMDQKLDRLAAQGFEVGENATGEAKLAGGSADGEEDGDGDGDGEEDEDDEEEVEEEPKKMPLQDVPPNSSELPKPKLRLKPLAAPDVASGPENVLPPSSPLSPVPVASASVSPSEPTHPGPTFAFDTPARNSFLFSPFDDDSRRGYGVLGKAFGDDEGLGKPFAEEIKLGGGKRVRAFKSTARLDDDAFPLLGSAVGLSSPLRIGRSRSVPAVESPTRQRTRGDDGEGEAGSEPETPRTNAAKVAARRLQLFALESPVANVTPMRRVTLSRSMTTPVMSTALGSHASMLMGLGQTPLADGDEELARALGLAPDMAHHRHSEDSPVRKRKRGPNTPFPIYPSSKLRESVDECWSSPFVLNTPAPASKRARRDDMGVDGYANEMIAGDLMLES